MLLHRKALVFIILTAVVSLWGCQQNTDGIVAVTSSFQHPMGAARTQDGRLFVADATRPGVALVNRRGELVRWWPTLESASGGSSLTYERPMDVALTPDGHLLVPDYLTDQIIVADTVGHWIAAWGSTGIGRDQFDAPAGVAVDNQGRVYVADFYNHRIAVWSVHGVPLGTWGQKGHDDGQFFYPSRVTVDTVRSRLYVSDAYNHRVQVFTLAGKHLATWGSYGSGPGQFNVSAGLTLTPHGIWVADFANHRIQQWTVDGRWIKAVGDSTWWDRPVDVITDGARVGVLDFGGGRVVWLRDR